MSERGRVESMHLLQVELARPHKDVAGQRIKRRRPEYSECVGVVTRELLVEGFQFGRRLGLDRAAARAAPRELCW